MIESSPSTDNDKITTSSLDGHTDDTTNCTIIQEEKIEFNTEKEDESHDEIENIQDSKSPQSEVQSFRNIEFSYDEIVDSDEESPIEGGTTDNNQAAVPTSTMSLSQTQNSAIIESDRSNTSIIDSLRLDQGPIMNIISNVRSISRYITTSRRNTDPCCSICLDEYQVGDEVCWSKNQVCVHIHHLDCMLAWLQDHDDCPLCREVFVL